MPITTTEFGKTHDGNVVTLFTLSNKNGMMLKMIDYGAIVVAVEFADRDGRLQNINLGFGDLQAYLDGHPFFGASVGRFCNRIANGQFSLDGKTYSLAKNNGENHLHGGEKGFDKFLWKVKKTESDAGVGLTFSRTSPDGEEGYPGNLETTIEYFLGDDDSLKIEFVAKTDQATPVNLTNHCYWNLAGTEAATTPSSVYDHHLELAADQYLEVDDGAIPTGIASVKGTPFDFTSEKAIGHHIAETPGGDHNGYDHCYALRSQDGSLALAARVREPNSGRVMEVYTTQPGIQLYTGNFLDGSIGNFQRHGAFCLETQHYPDSPNQSDFPSSILRPGETFKETTVHKFKVE